MITPAEREAIKQLDIQRKKLTPKLDSVQKLRQENLIYDFHPGGSIYPNPKQQELLDAWLNPQYKTFTYIGVNQSGKTLIGPIIAFSVMFGKYPWNDVKVPLAYPDQPRNVLYVGQGWESHIKMTVEPEIKRWWPQSWGAFDKVASKNNQGVYATWTLPTNGSKLFIMSNIQDTISFEGGKWDLIIYDEPPDRDNRVAASRGLMKSRGRELFLATLVSKAWIHREVIKARLPNGAPDPSVCNIHTQYGDNISRCKCGEYILNEDFVNEEYIGTCPKCGPVTDYLRFGLTVEGVQSYASKLKKNELAARIYEGIPIELTALVLPNFRREIHLRPRIENIPLSWIFDIQIDYHPAKPWAILFMATAPRDFKYFTHTIEMKGGPNAVKDALVKFIHDHHMYVNSIGIDPLSKGDPNAHDREVGEANTVFSILEEGLAAYGYELTRATKDKTTGITMFNNLLMTENEMPGIFVFDDLGSVITQFEDWMFDQKTLLPSKKEPDEWCELAYRLVLQDTQWFDHIERNHIDNKKTEVYNDSYDPLGRK